MSGGMAEREPARAPVEDDPLALRNALWLITDEEYKGALSAYHKKKGKGIIFSVEDKKPIAFAVIRLIDPLTNKTLKETVSDLKGKYGVIVSPGNYLLTVSQEGFIQFS